MFEGSTGCHEWEAGFFLGELLLGQPDLVIGRAVLELGCGSGLVGVLLQGLGATAVWETDGDDETVGNAALNLRLNGAEPDWISDQTSEVKGGPLPAAPSTSGRAAVSCSLLRWEDPTPEGYRQVHSADGASEEQAVKVPRFAGQMWCSGPTSFTTPRASRTCCGPSAHCCPEPRVRRPSSPRHCAGSRPWRRSSARRLRQDSKCRTGATAPGPAQFGFTRALPSTRSAGAASSFTAFL